MLNANATATVSALNFSLLGDGGFTHADVVSTPTVLADVRNGGHVDGGSGDVTFTATATTQATATGTGFGFSLGFSGGGADSTATLNPTVKAYAGTNGTLGGRNIGFTAVLNASPNGAKSEESVGNIALGIGINGGNATANTTPTVETSVGFGTVTNATGNLTLSATSAARAFATSHGGAGGILAGIGASDARATSNGSVSSHYDGGVHDAAGGPGAANITIAATGTSVATASAQAVAGGLYGETKNYSEANVGPSVTASLNPGGGQLVATSSNITVNATAFPEGDANTHGVSGGLIGVGGSESLVTITPTVGAALTGSQVHAGGSIQVLANAEPFTSPDAPDYSIQGVDPANDTLNVNNHGLQTGDTVQYNPNGHALIGGLVTTYVDNSLGDAITLTRPYNVLSLDDNHLALGTAFPASGVDSHREIITFKLAHNFQTGDAVTYRPEGSGSVSGLTDGTVYYVVVLDDTRIKLVSTHAEAVSGATQYHFSPSDISSNTISVAGSGFSIGQAVQYHSPAPTSFATGQVDFIPVYNSDGTINVARATTRARTTSGSSTPTATTC